MGTREYGYNQICICTHIIMGSQIPVYYTRGYPFSYPLRARDGFYPRVPVDMDIFATPSKDEIALNYRNIWDKFRFTKLNVFILTRFFYFVFLSLITILCSCECQNYNYFMFKLYLCYVRLLCSTFIYLYYVQKHVKIIYIRDQK